MEDYTCSIKRLVEIMEKLLGDQGCPWDREQTHESLKRYLIEETYEVVEAIDENDKSSLQEELGDVLLQIVFHSQLAKQNGDFDFNDVIDGVADKMVRRHPHVFGDIDVKDSAEVSVNWERIKSSEKKVRYESILDKVPKNLPSLHQALKIQEKASGVGFDWPEIDGAFEKYEEENREFKEALNKGNIKDVYEEYGDMLFSLVNIGRFLNINPEESLFHTINKFRSRFAYIEKEMGAKGEKLDGKSIFLMEKLWKEAKNNV